MKKLMPHLKKFKPHLIAIGLFIAISAIYCSPVFDGKILSAHDVDTWKGMSKEVQDHRSETGDEALWTKRMFSGMPSYQISTQSNGNLIQYVDKVFQLGLPRPMNLLFMYLIGFYILLLTLKIDYKIAIVGAIGFAFSSYFIIIIQAGHMTKAHAIAYLPLIIASVLYTFRSKKWILGAAFTSLFVALQLYSNHYQITYYTVIILFFIGIVQFLKELQEKTLPNFFKKVGVLIIAALLGGATNYTRLATTMEYGPETQRGKSELVTEDGKEKNDGLGLEYATRWSYGKAETMTFLIPNFMGGTKSVDDPSHLGGQSETLKLGYRGGSAYWGNQPGTAPTYVGAIIMFLFVLGILYVKSPFRIWILLTTILSIMLGWGHNFMGLTEFFFNYVPYYNKFRAVTMAMIIAEFGIALLAILALNKFLNNIGVTKEDNKEKEKKLKLAFYMTGGITLLLAIIPSIFLLDFLSENELKMSDKLLKNALSNDRESILKSDAWRSFIYIFLSVGVLWMFIKGNIKKQYVVIVFGILILFDMWSVDKRYLNETHFVEETESSFIPTKADKKILKDNKNNSRVFNLNNPFNESATSYHHNSIGGYHAAKLLRYQEIIDRHLTKKDVNKSGDTVQYINPHPNVLSMLNCGWYINKVLPKGKKDKPNNYVDIAISSTSQGIKPAGDAWFVSEIDTVENANEELEYLDSFIPETTAIIDKRFLDKISKFTKNEFSTITLDQKSYKPNHLTYHLTNIDSKQLAVFSEIYYEKGWNAYIEGNLVPHFRANYVLRAMMVPAGTTKIEFKFEPTSYSIGESVAYASSIILLLLLGFVSYKELKLKIEESIEE
jgi:hypothetical protein